MEKNVRVYKIGPVFQVVTSKRALRAFIALAFGGGSIYQPFGSCVSGQDPKP